MLPRRFLVECEGTTLASGVVFPSGHAVAQARFEGAPAQWFESLEHAETVLCAGGHATIVMLD